MGPPTLWRKEAAQPRSLGWCQWLLWTSGNILTKLVRMNWTSLPPLRPRICHPFLTKVTVFYPLSLYYLQRSKGFLPCLLPLVPWCETEAGPLVCCVLCWEDAEEVGRDHRAASWRRLLCPKISYVLICEGRSCLTTLRFQITQNPVCMRVHCFHIFAQHCTHSYGWINLLYKDAPSLPPPLGWLLPNSPPPANTESVMIQSHLTRALSFSTGIGVSTSST